MSRVKLAKFSAKLVANFRRSLEGDLRASFAGEIVRSIFHRNSTANFTIRLHYEVLGCGGPYRCRIVLPEELLPLQRQICGNIGRKSLSLSRYRYRFSLVFRAIFIADTDFGLETNESCNDQGRADHEVQTVN